MAVEQCSLKRADAVRSVSPTYLPGHGMELAPAQGMWYIWPIESFFSNWSLGLTSVSLIEPRDEMDVLSPLLLKSLDSGSVTPEK